MNKGEKDYGHALNKLYKNTKSILGEYPKWFEDLSDAGIDKIYCYGLSFGKVDDVYYQEIIERLPNVQWTFYIHEGRNYIDFEKNKASVRDFIGRMRIDKNKCKAYYTSFLDRKISL